MLFGVAFGACMVVAWGLVRVEDVPPVFLAWEATVGIGGVERTCCEADVTVAC